MANGSYKRSADGVRLARSLLFAFIALSTSSALADIEVEPIEPWEIEDGYAYYATGGTNLVFGEGFQEFNTTVGQDTASEISGKYANAIQFEITGESLPSGTDLLVVYAELQDDDQDGGAKPVPIGTVNGLRCEGSTVCSKEVVSDYRMAVDFTGAKIKIGVYPADICLAVYSQISTNPAEGCSSQNFTSPTATAVTKMKLIFAAIDDPGGNTIPVYDELASSVPKQTITLQFQSEQPTLSCPASFADSYYPGDGEIYLNTEKFSGSSSFTAPLYKLMVVADRTALSTGATYTGNEIVKAVDYSDGTKAVGGFKNSEGAGDNQYFVAFEAMDRAGVISNSNTNFTSCQMPNYVQTSAIEGFLQQSRCFIATAAFASRDAAPVSMLRRFRDDVLLRNSAGRAFVDWYYDWSPGAARWLLEHPFFRLPVLRALVPVQLLAWLILKPLLATLLALMAVALLVLAQGWSGLRLGLQKESRSW